MTIYMHKLLTGTYCDKAVYYVVSIGYLCQVLVSKLTLDMTWSTTYSSIYEQNFKNYKCPKYC